MDASLISASNQCALARRKTYFLALIVLVFTAWDNVWATTDHGTTVMVVKTKSHPKIDAVVAAINASIAETANVKLFDLQGQATNNDIIVGNLADAIRGTNAVLVAIGTPATQLLAKSFPDLPLIYTMTRTESIPELATHDRALLVSDKTPLAAQLTTLQRLVSPLHTVGILVGSNYSRQLKDELRGITSTSLPSIRMVSVQRAKDIPSALSELSAQVDALVFVQDPSILNRNSLEYIVTHTLAQKKPSMVYSEYLVHVGFLAANLVSPESIGQRTKAAITEIISDRVTRPLNVHRYQAREYSIVVNQHTLELLGLTIPAPENIEYFSP